MTSYEYTNDIDSNNSDDEIERRQQEAISNAEELEAGDLQTYAHHLFLHLKEYLALRGSHLLNRCTFPAFLEFCRAEREEHGSKSDHSKVPKE